MLLIARRFILCLCSINLLFSLQSNAETVWIDQGEVDFEIYDIFLDDGLLLFESSDIYLSGESVLLPFNSIVSALEINLSYDATQQRFSGRLNGKDIELSISNPSQNIKWKILLLNGEKQLFIDTDTLSFLIDADVMVSNQDLRITLTAKNEAFPLQVRLGRDNRKVVQQNVSTLDNYSFIVEDQYRLFTPPNGLVSVALTADQDGNDYNINLNTYNDILYHSANLSLAKNDEGKLTKRLTMTRETLNPTDKFIGGINRYAFGDVSASNNRGSNSYSGTGLVFSSFENRYSSHFGKVTIDEYATANWAAELYQDGFLIATGTVGPDGRIIFKDINVNYGSNRFEIKTYGDFGEQQSIIRDILVGQNLLKPGEFRYDGGLIDTQNSLFNDNSIWNADDHALAGFFQGEFGLNQNTSLGFSLFINPDAETISNDNEAVFSVTHQLSNALIDVNFSARDTERFSVDGIILGSLGRWTRYQMGINYSDNYDQAENSQIDDEKMTIRGNLSGRIGLLSYSFNGRMQDTTQTVGINTIESRLNSIDNTLSWRYKNFNFGNTISYQNYDFINGLVTNSGSVISDQVSVSSALTDTLYLRSTAKFNISGSEDKFNSIDANLNWRLSNKFNLNTSAEYFKNGDYRLTSYASWQRNDYNLTLGANYANNDYWNVSLGISVGLDYDYYQNKVNFTNQYGAATGTLDLLTFIDNNKNAIYDEYDEALENVGFGSAPQWRDSFTNRNGNAYLPGVSTRTPVKVYFDASNSRASQLTPIHDNFAFYTHPGGVTSLDVPFNYNGNVEGNIIFDDSDGNMAIKAIPIQIIDNQNKVIKEVNSSFDNYFVFDGLWPGKYKLRIEPEFLNERGLQSTPEMLELILTGADDYVTLEDLLVSYSVIDLADYGDLAMDSGDSMANDNTLQEIVLELEASPDVSATYSIQIGSYSENTNCLSRMNDLKNKGVSSGFYQQDNNLCKVYVGKFETRSAAQTELQKLRATSFTQSYIVRMAAPLTPKSVLEEDTVKPTKTPYAIQLGAYTSDVVCSEKRQEVLVLNLPDVRKQQVNGLCKVFSGQYSNKQQAQLALSVLPQSILKGAFIVHL